MQNFPHNVHFNRNPVFLLAVCFAGGILFGKFVAIPTGVALAATCAFAAAAFFARGKVVATVFISLAFAAAGAAAFQSEEKANSSPNRIKALYDSGIIDSGTPVEIEGVITAAPEAAFDGTFLLLRAESLLYKNDERTVTGNVRIFVPTRNSPVLESKFEMLAAEPASALVGPEPSNLKYGSRISVACNLEREDEFLNPGVVTRRELLDRTNTDAACAVKSSLLIEHLADESVLIPLRFVYDVRARLINEFRQQLSPRAAGVMIASLLGNKYFLDKQTADLFREGGTFHILVISGLHITFIGGLLFLAVGLVTRRRLARFAVTSVALWAYTLSVGAGVPVVRAALMFTLISFSFVVYREISLLNSYGLCGLILLAWRPAELFDPSFQLTFVSVAALIACAFPLIKRLREIGEWTPSPATPFPPDVRPWLRALCETLYWRDAVWEIERKRQIWTAKIAKVPFLRGRIKGATQRACSYLFEGLLVSALVQAWMLPLTVVYFHRVSVVSVVLNLWVSVAIAFASFAALAGAAAGTFSDLLAAGFYSTADFFNRLLLAVPDLFSDAGWAGFRPAAYSERGRLVYVVYFVPLVLLSIAITRWQPFAMRSASIWTARRTIAALLAAIAVLTGVIAYHPLSATAADGRLHVDFLDVGQGDAILVTFPDGRTLLVDGGGRPEYGKTGDATETFEPDVRGIGEAVVSEVLWAKGYSHVDHILATHADADHIQGLADVAKDFEVGSAIFGRIALDDPEFAELADVLERRGIPAEIVARGDVLRFGDCLVEVIYPLATGGPYAVSDNDHSVVLRLVYGSRALLLTGDIERAAESALLTNGGTLRSDVVKVAHHGSRTSSTQQFIDATRAGYAIVSVGRNSPFGHPHSDVIARWQASGVQVFTTGDNGMISVSTDGKDLRIDRF